MTLRLMSYLAPSVPAGLFEVLADHIGAALGTSVELSFDTCQSGPRLGDPVGLAAGTDLAFICATSYIGLTGGHRPAVEPLAAWAPTDPRAEGAAIYFADVLARPGRGGSLKDLAGARVAYNDDVSLSGYHSLRLALLDAAVDLGTVGFVQSGSHLRSLRLLRSGQVDAAAIDANVWRRLRREVPQLADELRQIATLGPLPAQPLVARCDLPAGVRRAVRGAVLAAHHSQPVAAALAAAELQRFVAVDDAVYGPLRADLAARGSDAVAPV